MIGEGRAEEAWEDTSYSVSVGVEPAGDAENRVLVEVPDVYPDEEEVAISASGT